MTPIIFLIASAFGLNVIALFQKSNADKIIYCSFAMLMYTVALVLTRSL